MNGQHPHGGGGEEGTGKPVHFEPLGPDDPATVAGYRIAARLGAGGMGKVYLSHTPGGRPVAVKVIRPEFAEDPEFRRRFAQEIRSAQRVQGLFTAPVIDADTDGPHPWLATAYVPGPSLAAAVSAHGALPVETVLLLVAGIAEALQVIHGAGIVHRDLKPSNVLLAADGPRVIDFGIAHAADATSLTGSGVAVGTPAFMAPEQAAGRGVGPATDIFALGQVAAYAAAGAPAFGEGASHGVLYRIVHEEPDLSGVPQRLSELVTRCLAKDPADRPTVAEVIALCQSANDATTLRRAEDWLPPAVTAEITARSAAPAAAPATPATAPATTPAAPAHPPTAPAGVAHQPTAPGGVAHQPTSPAGAPYTPPPAAAPQHAPAVPPALPPQHGYQPAGPYTAPQFAPAAHPHPAHTGQFQVPAAPGAQRKPRGAVLAVLAIGFAVAVSAVGYNVIKGKDEGSQATGSSAGAGGSGIGGSAGSAAKPSGAAPRPDPQPADYKGINLVAGYHLTLGDENLRPQKGEDGGYELSYDTGSYLDAEAQGGSLVLLDPGQEGSLATCRAETRFTQNVKINQLGSGRQVCVTTGTGHLGLVTVRGISPEDSPSKYLTLDVTVWRNAAAGSNSR
ncbi:serine/threonine protein kinase [Streptomyces sp. WAC05292]|uniref:serine/threonine-protein kinase n=1 Tax=Streptomyces sp. WAC05292 TaxID=2487418 RepID=UPI000F73BAB2|nr:serine/threonine-protein kinase [Streptomyces sp. WAC05292]RSS84600.1 serine/threonine protein kinase [Streptomyces sp. WAC05292]